MSLRIACRQSESATGHDISSTHDSITLVICAGSKPLTSSVGSGEDGREEAVDWLVAGFVVVVVVEGAVVVVEAAFVDISAGGSP